MITRHTALQNLQEYIGQFLSDYAKKFGITIFSNGHLNKGWKGQVLEKLAGLEGGNEQAPNGLGFELKSIAFKQLKSGEIVPKETMAITMINPKELINTPFFESHCWEKLKSLVVCAVMWYEEDKSKAKLLGVSSFDMLKDEKLIKEIEADYEFIRNKLINKGFESLTGKDGKWIQARTKGTGGINPKTGERRPITRAFYARKCLIKELFGNDFLMNL